MVNGNIMLMLYLLRWQAMLKYGVNNGKINFGFERD